MNHKWSIETIVLIVSRTSMKAHQYLSCITSLTGICRGTCSMNCSNWHRAEAKQTRSSMFMKQQRDLSQYGHMGEKAHLWKLHPAYGLELDSQLLFCEMMTGSGLLVGSFVKWGPHPKLLFGSPLEDARPKCCKHRDVRLGKSRIRTLVSGT